MHQLPELGLPELQFERLRLTRIPKGADLILNKVAGAPGFLDRQST